MGAIDAANAIPLLTAFKGQPDFMKKTITDTVIKRSSIMALMPMVQIPTGFTWSDMESVTGQYGNPSFRGLNEDFADTFSELRERQYGVKQCGDAVTVEKKIERQVQGTLRRQLMLKLEGLGMFLDDTIINGNEDTNAKQFTGLRSAPATIRVGSASDITVSTSAATLNSAIDRLRDAIRAVNGPNAIFMSDVLYDAFRSGVIKTGANVFGTTSDLFNINLPSLDGIPIYKLGNNHLGLPILPFTETNAAGSTGSVYIVKLEEENGVCGLSTGAIQILPHEDNLFHRDVIDFDFGLVVRTNSAARASGFKA